MLELTIILSESFNEETNEFVYEKETIQLEHSLYSVSKWESITHKPYLGNDTKTREEALLYVQCMVLNENFDKERLNLLTRDDWAKLNAYIEDPHSATVITHAANGRANATEIVTSEIVYYWMSSYKIPWEAQHWHFQRLLKLIEVFGVKSAPPKKLSKREIMDRNRALNEQRKQELRTRG